MKDRRQQQYTRQRASERLAEESTSAEQQQLVNPEVSHVSVKAINVHVEVADHRNEYLHTGQVLREVSEYINKSGEKNGPDHEEIERIVSFCEALASIISVPEEGEESGSVPEAERGE